MPGDASESVHRIGVDAGGTFTDCVAERADGTLIHHKLPSTPAAPSKAVLEGVAEVARGDDPRRIVHGSTVATNAFLERTAAPVGMIVTAGFADVLAIGRQNRRRLYVLRPEGPRRLVPPGWIREVGGRTGHDGEVVEPVDPDEVAAAGRQLVERGARAIVVAFLHSARHPALERRAVEALEGCGVPVVPSHGPAGEPREYERWATAVVDASLAPIVRDYLAELEAGLPGDALRIMLSNGGMASASVAADRAVATILSGPVAGVVGARLVARAAGFERIVTFDMGGTSCDVAVVPGEPLRTTESEMDGIPVRVPLVDIQTVGAGGGSIARVDRAGALVVGPESAGADPGPACYGLGGEEPTVTDAHLVLGRLDPDRFLGGRRPLDPARAETSVDRLATALGAGRDETACAILAVTRSHLERAIRRATLERGYDPADFVLVAFGGAGGLHAAALAESLCASRVLVPRSAGLLSALGCLAADVRLDFGRAVLEPVDALGDDDIEEILAPLERRAGEALDAEGVPPGRRELRRTLAVRYRGQAFDLPVSWGRGDDLAAAFHDLHRTRYGHAREDEPVEIVTARVAAVGRTPEPRLADHEPIGEAELGRRRVGLADGRRVEAEAWRWEALVPGHASEAPAVVLGDHATALVPPGWRWRVGRRGDLHLERT